MGDIFEQAPAGKMFSRSGTQKLQMLLPIIPLGKRILGKANSPGTTLGTVKKSSKEIVLRVDTESVSSIASQKRAQSD